jgi:hypothetical protein
VTLADSLMLADSYWQRNSTAISLLGALVIALVVGWLIPWLWRQRDRASKTLDYRLVSDIQIVTTHGRPDTLRITLGPLEVQNPFLSQIRFKNTGKQVIHASDFLEPLEITRASAKLLDFVGCRSGQLGRESRAHPPDTAPANRGREGGSDCEDTQPG